MQLTFYLCSQPTLSCCLFLLPTVYPAFSTSPPFSSFFFVTSFSHILDFVSPRATLTRPLYRRPIASCANTQLQYLMLMFVACPGPLLAPSTASAARLDQAPPKNSPIASTLHPTHTRGLACPTQSTSTTNKNPPCPSRPEPIKRPPQRSPPR